MSSISNAPGKNAAVRGDGDSFGTLLRGKIEEINQLKLDADDAIAKVELSDSGSIHNAMIALEKADISFRAMMQVRNRMLEAYQEVMRMQV
ncbi:MAG: flagellar hook-basal body complex protein FliE [Deltaproteobacteria bacterium]|nr:flagellar hook-basal body complex protein FliE [Deltaproteobacteria bacterium]MBW2673125.1 flagellar hook-basal body complex protein FliE [Deltaproteobacteria bacterium]